MSKTVPFQTIPFSTSTQFKCNYTVYLSKTFIFQAIQFSQIVLIQTILFSINILFSSIQPISRALSDAIIPGQSEPGSNGNEGVLFIPQSSNITRTSPSDGLVSYPGLSSGVGYPSAEVLSVYSIAPADWAIDWNYHLKQNYH